MRTFRWTKIILLTFISGALLPACSTVDTVVPDNMQFWDGVSSFSEDSPNLNETPSEDAILQARAQADNLRSQLEEDRARARRIAMGLPLPNDMAEKQQETYDANFSSLSQTQRAMWIRHDTLTNGTMSANVGAPIIEQDLPPEMFVPGNVVVNYDIVPEVQYQRPLYASQAVDYIHTNSVITNPEGYSDLQYIDNTDSQYKIDVPEVTGNDSVSFYGEPNGIVFFDFGSSSLTELDLAFLKEIATEINETTGIIRIVGHASAVVKADNPTLGRAKNLMMSDKRAATVMKALVAIGVDRNRIEVSAYGDSLPIFEIDGKTPEEADRRVEIYY